MTLFLGENQCFYQNKSIFCYLTDKVLKIYSYYLCCFKLDAVLFNLIHVVVYTYKDLPTYFRFFATKRDIFKSRNILGNACIVVSYISEHCHIKKMTCI